MKVKYTSPLTGNRQYMIDADGVKYHLARDMAVLKIKELTKGDYHCESDEINKQFRIIRRSKSAITRKGYFATPIIVG